MKLSLECTTTARSESRFAGFPCRSRQHAFLVAAGIAATLGGASICAFGSLVAGKGPGLLLGAGNSISRWLENAESGSGVENALYRLMKLPGGEALYRRSPREARPELTDLINTSQNNNSNSQNSAALYSLRAMEDEQALDFDAAEKDWKSWVANASDKPAANLDLADFYERRLKPEDEIAALEAVGGAAASALERWTQPEAQRSWKAWERTLEVVNRYALPRAVAQREYAAWERRYPDEPAVYEQELAFDLTGKDFAGATALTARYQKAFPQDALFVVRAQAHIEAGRGSAKDGLAVFDRSFQPLWPAELVKGYYDLLESGHLTLKTRDELRAKLASSPDGGADALIDAAKLFYIDQQQGQLEAAKAVLEEYRTRKDDRGAAWSSDELFTFARLLEQVQDFSEAARYYYAMAAEKKTPDEEQKGLAGLARLLLTAPEQPFRVGAGNLALYKSIATMDRGPGYLNGILSLFLNSQQPAAEYSTEDQLAVPYFHRAKAAEIVADIDRRFPNSPERPGLHVGLMDAYAAYGEDDAVIREGKAFLADFPNDPQRIQVALTVADVYSRTNQAEKEFDLYKNLLKELAASADGVPLGEASEVGDQGGAPASGPSSGSARSSEYAQVLDKYLSRLVSLGRLPDALEVLRDELDRNPEDPGLYNKLAQFLEQNRLNAREEDVYQRAIAQFQSTSFGTVWYSRLARFYLRERRAADYSALTHQVTGIFSGTELESYLSQAPAPDQTLALEVELYANRRFPHDLAFVRALLSQYRIRKQQDEVEKLLWQHWAESPDLRDQLFEALSSAGRLDAQLQALRQQSPEIEKADWTALAQTNPAAERFWLESCLWQSHYEDGVGAAEALAAEYPADEYLGRQASSLERSLAYFHPEDTDKAVTIEKRLLSARPDDLDTLARIGDIYADRGRMAEAAPYWTRMAEVHPGEADGYLQSATVFWDYFDFDSASAELTKARQRLADPDLFGYEAGAIEESRGNLPGAIEEYVASSQGDKPSDESRGRLLELARRADTRSAVDAATAGLLKTTTPTANAIELRVSVLGAQHRTADMVQELKQAVAQTDSFDALDALTQTARNHSLPEVEQSALRRQIALTSDPVHVLELRYQLVDLLEQHNPAEAANEVDAIYRDHPKILGVVRSTVDYDWNHDRKPQAVTVLLSSADVAYPDLKQQFQLEAARKLTDLGDFQRSKGLLEPLLAAKPLDAGVEAALTDNYARCGDQAGLEIFFKAELAGMKSSSLGAAEKTARTAQLRRGMISAASLTGNWGDAADQYIELINAYPGDETLTQEAALTAGAHGQRDKLIDFYRKTVENSPRDARWSIVLARLETALEDYPAAIDAYSKAIRVRPEQKDLYQLKADLEERLQKLDDAVTDYEQLYRLSYHDPQWMVKVAQARARQNRRSDAVKALEEAWVTGRPQTAANFFTVASQLEQWGLLDDARAYAEKGVDAAGSDLLIDPANQNGAAVYARIMARQRQTDAAFTKLAVARMKAEDVPLSAVAEQVAKDGLSAITSEEWRKQRIAQRTDQARTGFGQAFRSMAAAVGEYYTPEEKAQFASWLQAKMTGVEGGELRAVYLPAIQAAGLVDVEANLLWEFTEKSGDPTRGELSEWLQLERSRDRLEETGPRIEALAASAPVRQQTQIWSEAAGVYQALGDASAELRARDRLASLSNGADADPRYYELLLAERPQDLVRKTVIDSAAQYLVANGSAEQALAGVAKWSSNRPPVWKNAYTGLTGLYFREHTPLIRTAFSGALGGDATIGERIAQPVNRDEQLAGEVWFYYASRFGEYLDAEKDADAEDYLQAELEHTPVNPDAYVELADYSAQAGRADAALADYSHSLDLKSDQPAVLDRMATIEWKQGKQADALAAWQLAVKRLAAEMDARHVPESFWGDFAQVLVDAAANGQYAAIDAPVDAMLRVYLARNGDYRAQPLLEAGYHAHGDSMDWLLGITSAANDQAAVLESIRPNRWQSEQERAGNWIREGQMSQLLARILEIERRKAQAKPDEEQWALAQAESNLITALLDEKKFAQARAEFLQIPEGDQRSAQWLGMNLRLAEADGSLTQLITQWKKHPESAPAEDDLRNAVNPLNEASKRMVLRFVYERALDARELTAPNFLGLAAIDLDENDTPGAMALLKRLTLVSRDPYTDADASANLLETRNHSMEAIGFLQMLAQAFPWDAGYKVRLAVATMAGNPQSQTSLQALAAVAADPQATYSDRLAAARALKGHSAPNLASGSAELDLLARSGCPGADQVNKPYFVAAREVASACATNDKVQEQILSAGLAADPNDAEMRLRYLTAAFADGLDARALVAAEPILQDGTFYGQINESPGVAPTNRELKPEEASKLTWLAIHAREKRHEDNDALALATSALPLEKDPARRKALDDERQRLETEAAREQENEARAPNIHADLDQDRVVRPRLLPGMEFVPRKPANNQEGDAE